MEVPIALAIELGRGPIALQRCAALVPGETLPLGTRLSEAGRMLVDGTAWAAVTCGERDGSAAVTIRSLCGTT